MGGNHFDAASPSFWGKSGMGLKKLNNFGKKAVKNFLVATTVTASLVASMVTPSVAFASTPIAAKTTVATEEYSNPSTLSDPEVEVDQATIEFSVINGQNTITAHSSSPATWEKQLQVFRTSDNALYAVATSGTSVSFTVGRNEESYYAIYGTSQSNTLTPFEGQDLWSLDIATDKNIYKEFEYFTISGNVNHPDGISGYAVYILDKNNNIVNKNDLDSSYYYYANSPESSVEYYAVIASNIADWNNWYGKPKSELTNIKKETSRVSLMKKPLEISISIDKTEIKEGENALLSYNLNYPLPPGYTIYLAEADTGNTFDYRDNSNSSSPSNVTFYGSNPKSYKAYVAENYAWGNVSNFKNILAQSNTVEVSKKPWSLSLDSSKSVFKTDEYGQVDWTTNQDLVSSNQWYYAIFIYDKTAGTFVGKSNYLHNGGMYVKFNSGGPHEYVAFAARDLPYESIPYEWNTNDEYPAGLVEVQAKSNSSSAMRAPWQVSISVDKNTFDPDELVTFSYTSNQKFERSYSPYYSAVLVDVTDNNRIVSHTSHWAGTLDKSFVSLFSEGSTHEYKLYIGYLPYGGGNGFSDLTDIQAVSNSVFITKKPWTVSPKIGIYTVNYDWYQEPMHFYDVRYVSTYQNSPRNPFTARLYNITEGHYMSEDWNNIGGVRIWTKLNDKNEYKWILGKFSSQWSDNPTLLYYETESPSFTMKSAGGPTEVNETAGGSNPSENCNQNCHGDPINSATGEYWDSQQDLVISQNGPLLGFVRSFSTTKRNQDSAGLGYGWTHNYEMKLRGLNEDGTDNSSLVDATRISIVQENGAESYFTKMSNGSYQAALRVKASLNKNSDGTFTFTRGKKDKYTFSSDGLLNKVTDRNDNSINLTYNSNKLTKIENNKGQFIQLTWANNHISQVVDHTGRTFKYRYDSSWNLTSTENISGVDIDYTYDNNHKVLSLQNVLGGTTTNTYNGDKIATQTDPKGNTISFAYQSYPDFSVTTVTYSDGTIVTERYSPEMQLTQKTTEKNSTYNYESYAYSPDGSLWKMTNSLGQSTHFRYDLDGNMISLQNAIGYATYMDYDQNNNLLKTTNVYGDTSTNTYDEKGNPTSTTSFEGRKKTFTVNPDGTIATSVSEKGNAEGANPAAFTSTYGYNAQGYLSNITDANGAVSTIETDSLGRAIRTVNAKGNEAGNNPNDYDSLLTYDAMGNVLTVTDELGNVTTATYDAMGNILTSTNALGQTTSMTYDNVGNLLSSTNQNGKTTTYDYDNRNRLTKITDPAGKVSEVFYDDLGHVNRTKDSLGRETHQEWNSIGQLVSSTDAEGKKSEFTYDANGNLLTSKDPLGNVTTYTYDPLERLSESKNALNQTTTMSYTKDNLIANVLRADGLNESSTYDLAGNAVTSTDAAGKVQTWAYDNLNRKSSYTDATANTESYTYDVNGQVLTQTRTDGSVVSYSYDKRNLLTSVDYPGTDMDISYTYDALGRKLTEQKGTEPAIEYAYDSIGHLTSRGPPGAKVSYNYDDLGNMTSMTYSSGRVVNYNYDDESQLTSLNTTGLGTISNSYNNRGLKTETTLPSGVKTSWNYDDNGRNTGFTVKNPADAELYKKNYAYNAISNITQKESTGSLPSLDDFTYDPLSRLTEQKKNADGTVTNAYEYSATGNLTKNNAVVQQFDDAGKILSSGTKAFDYDARGNRATTTDSADTTENATFGWNSANLLISKQFTKNNTAVNIGYSYSADGLLSSRSKDGQNTNNFVWDASGSIPLLLDDGVNEYIYSDDRTPVAQISKADGTVAYLHSDNIGSVTASTNSAGELGANTEYSPYGVNLGLRLSPFGFAGEWTDPDTNHSYLRARWLDTTTGTFLSRDPLVQFTGDAYGYAAGNPLKHVDPLGLFSIKESSDKAKDWLLDETNTTMMADLSTNFAGYASGLAVISLIPTPLSPIFGAAANIIGGISFTLGLVSTISSCVRDGLGQACYWSIATSAVSAIPFAKPIKYMGDYAKRNIPKHLNVIETARVRQLKMNSQIGTGFFQSAGYFTDLIGRYSISSNAQKKENNKC